MHTNDLLQSPNVMIINNANHSIPSSQWSTRALLGLGITFCVIGLTMACSSSTIETMESFRKSFHKMLSEPDAPYPFAQAAVLFYITSGVIMITLSLRKPNVLRAVTSFFGALMGSIVLSKIFYGRLDLFIMFQMIVAAGLVYFGAKSSNPPKGIEPTVGTNR